jgi:methanogenic corrinoid protein MtbC1
MMRDSQHDGQGDRGGDGLELLARTVVARIAARDTPRVVDDSLVAALARALTSPDPGDFETLRADLRRARIGETELVDAYFPAVARYLGCAWAEDEMPFTDVSIGTARMQAMLRQVGRDWVSNLASDLDGSTVLMVLPEGEQHSFGVMVLTGQLRRQGVSVQLQLGADARALRALAADRDFDCAMVSVACEERLALCAKLVKSLKDGSGGRLWVAVGGAVLDRPLDIRRLTGADIVTNDPRLALDGARMRALALVREVE